MVDAHGAAGLLLDEFGQFVITQSDVVARGHGVGQAQHLHLVRARGAATRRCGRKHGGGAGDCARSQKASARNAFGTHQFTPLPKRRFRRSTADLCLPCKRLSDDDGRIGANLPRPPLATTVVQLHSGSMNSRSNLSYIGFLNVVIVGVYNYSCRTDATKNCKLGCLQGVRRKPSEQQPTLLRRVSS